MAPCVGGSDSASLSTSSSILGVAGFWITCMSSNSSSESCAPVFVCYNKMIKSILTQVKVNGCSVLYMKGGLG